MVAFSGGTPEVLTENFLETYPSLETVTKKSPPNGKEKE